MNGGWGLFRKPIADKKYPLRGLFLHVKTWLEDFLNKNLCRFHTLKMTAMIAFYAVLKCIN